MRRQRDSQKQKVYKADNALKPFQQPLPGVWDVERFAVKVWKSERVRAAFPAAVVYGAPQVKDGRGCRIAKGAASFIIIPRWARNTAIVLHELAHTVTLRVYGHYVAAHGWEYCSVYLKLTLYMMGREAHDALQAAMKEHRVRYKPKRQRAPLSPERKAQLAEVLAYARQKRELARQHLSIVE